MTDAPLRFLHTADWQLGLRARYIPGDAGAAVRDARLRTVRRIGEVARERDAAFVVVAGDVFEHHGLLPRTLRQTFDVLGIFGCPVYLLPGNHDPGTPDALYRSNLWQRECPANVHVLDTRDPVAVRADAHLLPCPLTERYDFEDPTAHLNEAFGPAEGFRIGVAHGGIREILARLDENPDELVRAISVEAATRGGLDYLALGDWHGLLRVDERTWYPGAPEATRFKEKKPGHVLLVELSAPGAPPQIEPVEVQTLRWRQVEADVNDDEEIDALGGRLDTLDDALEDCLVELHLRGTLDVDQHAQLETEVLARARDRFRWVRLRDEELHVIVREEALQEIAQDGWVGDVVAALAADPSPDAPRALRLLYRLAVDGGRP